MSQEKEKVNATLFIEIKNLLDLYSSSSYFSLFYHVSLSLIKSIYDLMTNSCCLRPEKYIAASADLPRLLYRNQLFEWLSTYPYA